LLSAVKCWSSAVGPQTSLTISDKHQLGAYRADPARPANGAILVVPEIFGVNTHIRAVGSSPRPLGRVADGPASPPPGAGALRMGIFATISS